MGILFSAELKPHGYYLEHFWQADLDYIRLAMIGVKAPNSSHVACSTKEYIVSTHFEKTALARFLSLNVWLISMVLSEII